MNSKFSKIYFKPIKSSLDFFEKNCCKYEIRLYSYDFGFLQSIFLWKEQVDFGPPMSFSAATAESCTLDHVFRFKGHPYAALRIHKTKA